MSEDTAEILAGTRTYIETNGWWRGGLFGPNGRQACVMGGLIKTLGVQNERELTDSILGAESMRAIIRVLVTRPGPIFVSIPDWNDDKEDGAKNKQDVLDVLAKAEKIERAGFDPDAP